MQGAGGFDEFGCAFTINDKGEQDYGDSMANSGRAMLVGLTDVLTIDFNNPNWTRAPKHISCGPGFWHDPSSVSRDQIRPWIWLWPKWALENKAPNGDILLPRWLLRLQVFIEVLIAIGLIPVTQHDKPWGLGRAKRFCFTWQDEDYCDLDANLICDLEQMRIHRQGGWLSRKLYKRFRGDRAVLHYYRAQAGGVVAIGEAYAKRIKMEW